jgi:formylglycine-generating enzyme required for sulfatase activity
MTISRLVAMPTSELTATKTPTQAFTPTAFPDEITENGVTMRLVPAGQFTMGSDADDALAECQKYRSDCQRDWFTNEEPPHEVYLDAFYMDKYEVTNALYKICVDAGGCTPPQSTSPYWRDSYYGNPEFDDYPVIFVDWNQSAAYCEWRDASLPTEAQWEKTARGTDKRTYPWGDAFDGTKLNFCDKNCPFVWADRTVDDGFTLTSPVGSYESGKSPYDIYDLAGNIWEWVNDWHDEKYYQSSPSSNPLGPSSGQYRVLRGGSWYDHGVLVTRSAFRYIFTPDYFDDCIGFRCARDATA